LYELHDRRSRRPRDRVSGGQRGFAAPAGTAPTATSSRWSTSSSASSTPGLSPP